MTPAMSRRALLLSTIGFAAAAGSSALPALWRGRTVAIDFDRMIPQRLGAWRIDPDARPVLPDQEEERSVADAYDAWTARVYRRDDGAAVMLVVAYGSATSRTLAIHRPETCYTAQGFTVEPAGVEALAPPYARIAATRLVAVKGDRVEPMMFWMTIAGRQSGFGISQNLALARAAWNRQSAEGYLVRASTTDRAGFPLVREFLAAMMQSVPPATRTGFGVNART